MNTTRLIGLQLGLLKNAFVGGAAQKGIFKALAELSSKITNPKALGLAKELAKAENAGTRAVANAALAPGALYGAETQIGRPFGNAVWKGLAESKNPAIDTLGAHTGFSNRLHRMTPDFPMSYLKNPPSARTVLKEGYPDFTQGMQDALAKLFRANR